MGRENGAVKLQKSLIFNLFFKVFAFLCLLGVILAQHGLLGRLDAVLDASWDHLEASWPRLGES